MCIICLWLLNWMTELFYLLNWMTELLWPLLHVCICFQLLTLNLYSVLLWWLISHPRQCDKTGDIKTEMTTEFQCRYLSRFVAALPNLSDCHSLAHFVARPVSRSSGHTVSHFDAQSWARYCQCKLSEISRCSGINRFNFIWTFCISSHLKKLNISHTWSTHHVCKSRFRLINIILFDAKINAFKKVPVM